jgi:predicted permease
LRETARAGGGRKERFRSALVIAEVTASVVLLVSVGLLLKALWHLEEVEPGFRPAGVLTLRTALPLPKYAATAARHRFYTSVLSGVRELPGVTNAAYVSFLPMAMGGGIWPISPDGGPAQGAGEENASLRYVTPGFFATLGIPLLLGRDVSESDTQQSLFVAVVSEGLAKRCWPGQNPIGRKFRFALSERTVVGIAGEIRVRGLQQSSEPQVYIPSQQVADGSIIGYAPKDLVIRTSADPETLLPAIRRIVRRADPEQPISDVALLTDIATAEAVPRLAQLRVIGAFAAIALLLAGIGMHGLLSYAVSQRTREIGVRMALGARRIDILRLVLRAGFALAGVGVVCGSALAYAAGRGMESLLLGVRPADPPTYLAAIGLALAMTLAGSLASALTAVRLDPMTAIRTE